MAREWFLTIVLFSTVLLLSLCLVIVSRNDVPDLPVSDLSESTPVTFDEEEVQEPNPRFAQVNKRLIELRAMSPDDHEHSEFFYTLSAIDWYWRIESNQYGQGKPVERPYFSGNLDSSNRRHYLISQHGFTGYSRIVVARRINPEFVGDYPHEMIWGAQCEKSADGNRWRAGGPFVYRYSDGSFLCGMQDEHKRNSERRFNLSD